MPSARYACRPDTARPQVDPGCLRIHRARQAGGVASNSAVGISSSGISPIGSNGAPHICPLNYRFPLTDPQNPTTCLIPSDLPCQTASGPDPPFFQNALDRQTHTQTQTAGRWLTQVVCNYSPLMLYTCRQQRWLIIAGGHIAFQSSIRAPIYYTVP